MQVFEQQEQSLTPESASGLLERARKFLRPVKSTLLFYFSYLLTAFAAEKLVPSGFCTPGLGALMLLFLPGVSVGLLLKNLFALMALKKPVWGAIGLHLATCLVLGYLWFTASASGN